MQLHALPTAGADGNVSQINLPGGIQTYFSGLGIFYPDGTPTQRIGIVPDIEVKPTLAGLRAGGMRCSRERWSMYGREDEQIQGREYGRE